MTPVEAMAAALRTALDELDPKGAFWDHRNPADSILLTNHGLADRLAAVLEASGYHLSMKEAAPDGQVAVAAATEAAPQTMSDWLRDHYTEGMGE